MKGANFTFFLFYNQFRKKFPTVLKNSLKHYDANEFHKFYAKLDQHFRKSFRKLDEFIYFEIARTLKNIFSKSSLLQILPDTFSEWHAHKILISFTKNFYKIYNTHNFGKIFQKKFLFSSNILNFSLKVGPLHCPPPS